MMPRAEVAGKCGCGRSPTGVWCGWHALTEQAYEQKRAEYTDAQVQKQRQDELEDYRAQAMSLWFDNGGSCTGAKPTGTPNIN